VLGGERALEVEDARDGAVAVGRDLHEPERAVQRGRIGNAKAIIEGGPPQPKTPTTSPARRAPRVRKA
jgi:hypothetical protein